MTGSGLHFCHRDTPPLMSRPLRLEFPGALYHVTARGDRREPIFEDDDDRAQLLQIVAQRLDRFDAVCLAYCLMGNHYHFVLQTRRPNLSRLMRHINGVTPHAWGQVFTFASYSLSTTLKIGNHPAPTRHRQPSRYGYRRLRIAAFSIRQHYSYVAPFCARQVLLQRLRQKTPLRAWDLF